MTYNIKIDSISEMRWNEIINNITHLMSQVSPTFNIFNVILLTSVIHDTWSKGYFFTLYSPFSIPDSRFWVEKWNTRSQYTLHAISKYPLHRTKLTTNRTIVGLILSAMILWRGFSFVDCHSPHDNSCFVILY